MIDKLLKNYGGRFIQDDTISSGSPLIPIYHIFDKTTGETTEIKIDTFNADIEVVIKNILDAKIIESRDKKIDSIIWNKD